MAEDEREAGALAEDDDLREAAGGIRPGVTMRHPLLLLAVLAGSVFMMWQIWPRASYLLQARSPADCGDISARPGLRVEEPEALPAFRHGRLCRLVGVVQQPAILATGDPGDSRDPALRDQGRKFYVKLDGDKVFAVLPGDRPDVVDYRLRHNNLVGFEVDETGRMFQPEHEPGYTAVGRTLRLKFAVADDEPIWVFDTTDTPLGRWPSALMFALMAGTALLAAFGLARTLRGVRR